MKTSEWGLKFIKRFEGLYLHTYDDGVGVATIGYGHTSSAGGPKVTWGQTITREEADQLLKDDLARVEKDVERLVKVPLNQNQFDALVSFHFNTGGLGKSTLLKKLNKGDYDSVPTELMKWNKGGGSVMAGLVTRRNEEGKLFTKPVRDTTSLVVPQKPTSPKQSDDRNGNIFLKILKLLFWKGK